MTLAKQQADWGRMSSLIAVLININRDPKKRAVQPHEYNPYADKRTENKEPDFYITPGELAKKLIEQDNS